MSDKSLSYSQVSSQPDVQQTIVLLTLGPWATRCPTDHCPPPRYPKQPDVQQTTVLLILVLWATRCPTNHCPSYTGALDNPMSNRSLSSLHWCPGQPDVRQITVLPLGILSNPMSNKSLSFLHWCSGQPDVRQITVLLTGVFTTRCPTNYCPPYTGTLGNPMSDRSLSS